MSEGSGEEPLKAILQSKFKPTSHNLQWLWTSLASQTHLDHAWETAINVLEYHMLAQCSPLPVFQRSVFHCSAEQEVSLTEEYRLAP